MRSYGFMLCGRFYISSPSLLVTMARGAKVPGAACSPFQSALTNHLLKWRTIMTTINLKRYYPYILMILHQRRVYQITASYFY